jgi:putative transposase
MAASFPENWPQFYTATVDGWKNLLSDDKYKDVIVNALQYLVENKRVKVNAFVIMNNHIHLIWQAMPGYILKDIQTSFKKFTSQQFIKLLTNYEINSADRKHHFWKRNSLGTELFTTSVFMQKLNYIHYNPVAAELCNYPEEYKYSSALLYEKDIDLFRLLEHYNC